MKMFCFLPFGRSLVQQVYERIALLILLVVTLFLAQPVFAADISTNAIPTKAPTYATVSSMWDGFYVGGMVGGQQGKSNSSVDGFSQTQKDPVCHIGYNGKISCSNGDGPTQFVTVTNTFPGASTDGNVIGVTFGAYGGYSKQINSALVVGVEVDGSWSGARDYVLIYNTNAEHKMPWNLNVTGKVGFLITKQQDTMLYLKGGMAVQNQQSWLSGLSGVASADDTKVGWTGGAGIEHHFTRQLAGRVEGMYTKVSDQTISIPGATTTLYGGSWQARVGLSWSFN